MKISIVYNNEAREGYKPGFGFACIINNKILFDTGENGKDLLFNIEKMGLDIKEIDKVVLSHDHFDHTGGLIDLLQANGNVDVYVLDTFSTDIKDKIGLVARLKIASESCKITDKVYTTGKLSGEVDEQSLILETDKGIVVVVGCSHPGVDNIIEKATEYGNVYAVIGGFHGFDKLEALKDIEVIGSCHCTEKVKEIKKMYPDKYLELKAGDSVEF